MMNDQKGSTRDDMQNYWQKFAPTIESMMLDKGASVIHNDEQKEILHLISPVLCDKRVLELGAGIGRFTGTLAALAKYVTAVDFREDYISANKKRHSSLQNISWIAADVLELKPFNLKFDVVFSNWLFMYLDDTECIQLLHNILRWLSDDGYLFIRESCFHSSGNVSRTSNPTFYRTPADYQNLLEAVRLNRGGKLPIGEGFHVIEAGSIKSYIKHKNNSYQIYFFSEKREMEPNAKDSFQSFLDQKQYTRNGVLRYEWMFGDTFLSTGGMQTTKDFITRLNLKPSQYILDAGCGIGGHDFYMAEKYGVNVLGIDLSANMMSIAIEHLSERPHLNDKVKFVMCDITKAEYEENAFDVVYSRDTFLHIEDKVKLFNNFLRWLKPGGKILFTDYSSGQEKLESDNMKRYVDQRGYHLLTSDQYKELLLNTGFINVEAENKTEEFLSALHNELNKLRSNKSEFMEKFSEEDYNSLESGWQDKIERVANGDQTWTACYGEKRSHS